MTGLRGFLKNLATSFQIGGSGKGPGAIEAGACCGDAMDPRSGVGMVIGLGPWDPVEGKHFEIHIPASVSHSHKMLIQRGSHVS